MTELWQLGALDLARQIRERAVTSREVVEAHLARIDAVNGDLNAIVRRFDDTALAAADRADAAVRAGDPLGSLHGVPCTIKENIDVAGTPTTQGVSALADAIAAVDAPTVERIRAAGAIPIGRTNLPDLGLRISTRSTLHGLTRNPWNPDVTAGGSSGGEAAAIASGMSPIGLGNDIGGSLRNPAHCCGIASIKPTVGVVPSATMIPPRDLSLAAQQMRCEGPMAREVSDVRAGLIALAGFHHRDPISVPARLVDLVGGERITVAVMPEPPGGATHPEIAAAVRRAGDLLADHGHHVVEATPPDYEAVLDMWMTLMITDVDAARPRLERLLTGEARELFESRRGMYEAPTLESVLALQTSRVGAIRAWSEFFVDHRVVLSPTWAHPAFEHDADALGGETGRVIRDTMRPVLPANLLGLPAAIVPCGFAAGLPVGVQVIGDRFTDLVCLAIAEQIQRAEGVHTPIDPVRSKT